MSILNLNFNKLKVQYKKRGKQLQVKTLIFLYFCNKGNKQDHQVILYSKHVEAPRSTIFNRTKHYFIITFLITFLS